MQAHAATVASGRQKVRIEMTETRSFGLRLRDLLVEHPGLDTPEMRSVPLVWI